MKKYIIERAECQLVDRDDEGRKFWEEAFISDKPEVVIEELLRAMNDTDEDLTDPLDLQFTWYRLRVEEVVNENV